MFTTRKPFDAQKAASDGGDLAGTLSPVSDGLNTPQLKRRCCAGSAAVRDCSRHAMATPADASAGASRRNAVARKAMPPRRDLALRRAFALAVPRRRVAERQGDKHGRYGNVPTRSLAFLLFAKLIVA